MQSERYYINFATRFLRISHGTRAPRDLLSRTVAFAGNWNGADLLLNCGRDSFVLKTEADYLNERQQI